MNPLAILVNILPEQEETLRGVLQAVDTDLAGNPYVRFPDSPHTHFARFVILSDDENGPRLLMTCNFDGEFEDYLGELAAVTLRPEAIWGHCEGYGHDTDLVSYLRSHSQKNRGVYVAFQDETVESVRTKVTVRQEIQGLLDHDDVAGYLNGERIYSFLDLLSSFPPHEVSPWTAFGNAVAALWNGFWKRLHDAFFALLLDPPIELAKRFSNAAIADEFDKVTVYTPEEVYSTPTVRKAISGQTSFTVYAKVKPGLRWRLRLAIALTGTSILARYGYPPGNFANVYTLWCFRWLWIDKRNRIVFQSTFDGSWENYMADFINNLVWALNALYASCEGYPEGGMADVYRFQRWILTHQPQPLVVYNAYPHETVLNFMKDREITGRLLDHYDATAVTAWLREL